MSDVSLLLSADTIADLSNCDREPIRIPSLIQPHGMLIAARDSDLRIVYVSENSAQMLALAPAALFQMTLPEVLGTAAVKSIQQALAAEQHFPPEINTFAFPAQEGVYFDAMSHRAGDLLCIELEPSREARSWGLLSTRLEEAIRELRRSRTLEELSAIIPGMIWELTGYDRVMVYRFDREGHGEIIAERKEPGMEPFLGLHYPATDIPQQARELYLLQRIRSIVDVDYEPVAVVGHPEFARGEPLDMTYCGLRSVSPIHLEYLRNMGVGASFGISLIQDKQLWGMILCHHRGSKMIAPEVRTLCDFLGQLISLLIRLNQQTSSAVERLDKKVLLQELSEALAGQSPIADALAEAGALLRLTGSDGAFIRIGAQAQLIGATPELADAASLMTVCRANWKEYTFSSDETGKRFPEFSWLASVASGVLLVPLQGPTDGILWFRGEVTQTVRWAGKPDASKVWMDDGFRLSPRKSFAAWEEVQRGRSLPWRPSEIEAALDLERICVKARADKEMEDLLALEQLFKEKVRQLNLDLAQRADDLERQRNEITLLNSLISTLQCCQTIDEAYKVVTEYGRRLFPLASGGVFIVDTSRNMVEAVAIWGDSISGENVFAPEDCWALRSGRPNSVDTLESTLRCRHSNPTKEGLFLCVPMMAQGLSIGILYLYWSAESQSRMGMEWENVKSSKNQFVLAVAEHMGLAFANLSLREGLRAQSIHDPLTNLFNRRYLEETLPREVQRASRNERPLGIIMIDIDHFKQYNDLYGHEAGDMVLRKLGSFLQSGVRGEDIVCRFGGEEFVLVLPDATLDSTTERAGQLLEGAKHLEIVHGHQTLDAITLSLGVSAFPELSMTPKDLLVTADAALYQAKQRGRNQVVVWTQKQP